VQKSDEHVGAECPPSDVRTSIEVVKETVPSQHIERPTVHYNPKEVTNAADTIENKPISTAPNTTRVFHTTIFHNQPRPPAVSPQKNNVVTPQKKHVVTPINTPSPSKESQLADTKRRTPIRQPSGIENEGNTCYVNASVQSVRAFLCLDPSSDREMVTTLSNLFNNKIGADHFINLAERKLNRDIRRQDDAAIFIRDLFGILRREDEKSTQQFLVKNYRTIFTCPNCRSESVDQRGSKFVRHELAVCTPRDSENIDRGRIVQIAVDELLKPKRERDCGSCGTVEMEGVVRFDCEKLIVTITDPYQMRPKTKLRLTINEHVYSLESVVYHAGSQNSGHYWAVVAAREKWFKMNDSSVTEVPDPRQSHGTPTMLVYSRRSQDDPMDLSP